MASDISSYAAAKKSWLLLLGMGVVFGLDCVMPQGYAIWLGYVGLIFATVFIDDQRSPWLVAGMSTVLIFIGVIVRPSSASPEVALVNRSLCVILLWFQAALLITARHAVASNISAVSTKALRDKEQSEEKLRVLSGELENRVHDRTMGTAAPQYSQPQPQGEARIPVLLVDDHIMVRQGLRSVMEAFPDIEIVGEASNGQEAIKLVERRRPAVVLMDINMPKLNGIEATARIKTEHPHISIIGLSINADSANQEAMRKAGAAMLLTKEGVIDELHNAIKSVSSESLRSDIPHQGGQF